MAEWPLEGKRPELSAGEPDDHGVKLFLGYNLYECKFLGVPRLGKFIERRGDGRTILNRRDGIWQRRRRDIFVRNLRIRGSIACPARLTFDPPMDCSAN
jgi:hypothetical protein